MRSELAIGGAAAVAQGRLERLLVGSMLAVALVFTCLLGFATSYVLILLAAFAAAYALHRHREIAWVFDGSARVFLAAFITLAVLFALTAKAPGDLLYAINFVAFVLYAPMATLFVRAAAPGNSRLLALLALAGAAAGCLLSVIEVYVLGTGRAGVMIGDPIRLANSAVILGFLALIGLPCSTWNGRWIFLLGPVLALLTVLFTGARIAMIAYPVLAFASIILLMRRKWLGLAGGLLVVALLVLAGLSGLFGGDRMASLVAIGNDIITGNPVADEATRIRLELYKAGWAAFQQSPLIGHGWAGLMQAPAAFLAETDKIHAELPHLHNEVLNFAVAGGLVGVVVYLVLIAMPVVVALRSHRDSQYQPRLIGCSILVVAYFIMGMTDTMISFELHTALYVAFTAILLAYCRDSEVRA